MKKIKWWGWLIIAVIVLGAIGAATGGGNSKKTSETREANAVDSVKETEATTTEQELKIGVPATHKDTTVLVESITYDNEGTDFIKPGEGMQFASVQVSITNDGKRELSVNPLQFKIKTSDGEILMYDLSAQVAEEGKSLKSMKLASGGKTSGLVSFEVPIGDNGMYLLYCSNTFDDKPLLEIAIK